MSAGQGLKAYDIHYIHGGVKKGMRHGAPSTTAAALVAKLHLKDQQTAPDT